MKTKKQQPQFGTFCYFCGSGYGVISNMGCSGDETSRPIPFKTKDNFHDQSYEPIDNYAYWCGQCPAGRKDKYHHLSTFEIIEIIKSNFDNAIFRPIGAWHDCHVKDTTLEHMQKVNDYDFTHDLLRELSRRDQELNK